jgi:hypothetical protein
MKRDGSTYQEELASVDVFAAQCLTALLILAIRMIKCEKALPMCHETLRDQRRRIATAMEVREQMAIVEFQL